MLGFYPDKIEYYQLALHHKSAPLVAGGKRGSCNERLEFLGDAILNSVITDIIYKRFPNKQEGFLTNLRSRIVSRESLNQLAAEIGLNKHVVASKHTIKNSNNNLNGNALEALFGAIYLDQGYRKCKSFVEDYLFQHFLDWDELLENEINFKSKMLEWCHKNHLEPEFVLIDEIVVKNRHTFRTCLKIGNNVICEATGSSKKESEQKASKIAYEQINNTPDFIVKLLQSPMEEEKAEIFSE
nr:ribonuclease III [Paludibacter sp. 221]